LRRLRERANRAGKGKTALPRLVTIENNPARSGTGMGEGKAPLEREEESGVCPVSREKEHKG